MELVAFGAAPGDGRIGWYETVARFPNITLEGQLVARAGYNASQWAAYLRLDGTRAMTGNLNMGGNKIANLGKVTLGQACDGSNYDNAALVGQLATITANASGLGAGYMATCTYGPYRAADGTMRTGYSWTKATAGPVTAEDATAGMMDGYETNADFTCNASAALIGTAWNKPRGYSTLGLVKGVFKNGKIYVYYAGKDGADNPDLTTWYLDPAYAAGADISTASQSTTQFSSVDGAGSLYGSLVVDSDLFGAVGFGCVVTNVATGATVFGSWTFSAAGFSYAANGAYAVDQKSASINGGIPVTSDFTVNIAGANCSQIPVCSTTCDAMTGVCNDSCMMPAMSCSPNGGATAVPVTLATQGVVNNIADIRGQVSTRLYKPIFERREWRVVKKSRCDPPASPCYSD